MLPSLPLPRVPVPRVTTAQGKRPACRQGMTLMELTVVLAILAMMAAIVAPTFVTRSAAAPTLEQVVSTARSNAIARAQTLALSVVETGAWTLRPLPPGDSVLVLAGVLEPPPAVALSIRIGPLGSCVVTDGVNSVVALDAARCQPFAATGGATR